MSLQYLSSNPSQIHLVYLKDFIFIFIDTNLCYIMCERNLTIRLFIILFLRSLRSSVPICITWLSIDDIWPTCAYTAQTCMHDDMRLSCEV